MYLVKTSRVLTISILSQPTYSSRDETYASTVDPAASLELARLVTNSYNSHSPAQIVSLWHRFSTRKNTLRNRWRKATSLYAREKTG